MLICPPHRSVEPAQLSDFVSPLMTRYGTSSLAQLQRYPFDELKIEPQLRAIAHQQMPIERFYGASVSWDTTDMKVVAEGVENRADWDFARRSGCDFAQGYFIAKPMPARDLVRWFGRLGKAAVLKRILLLVMEAYQRHRRAASPVQSLAAEAGSLSFLNRMRSRSRRCDAEFSAGDLPLAFEPDALCTPRRRLRPRGLQVRRRHELVKSSPERTRTFQTFADETKDPANIRAVRIERWRRPLLLLRQSDQYRPMLTTSGRDATMHL